MTTSPTYGPIDYLETTVRYTDVDAVKEALSINDTDQDDEITQAIIAAELAMDIYNGRSFPDTGDNPVIEGIPESIKVWALSASIGVYKLRDTVFGSAGVDDWLGSIDVGAQVEMALARNPIAVGFRISYGVA